MTITKIRKARAGVPDKIGEGVRKGKKSGEVGGGGRAGKERDREGTDGTGCVWQFRNLPHGCHIHISLSK